MQKKFTLTNETRVFDNQIFYRIKALKDFADIRLGIWVALLKRKITSLMMAIAGLVIMLML